VALDAEDAQANIRKVKRLCLCSALQFLFGRHRVSDAPDWIFPPRQGPTEADIISRLLKEFPDFQPRWQEHQAFWKGEPAGSYIDVSAFVHFLVEDLYPGGDAKQIQLAFNLIEEWLCTGDTRTQELVVLGFLEGIQNVASWQPFGSDVFFHFSVLSREMRGMNSKKFGRKEQFDGCHSSRT
jgi:hypothetical protein